MALGKTISDSRDFYCRRPEQSAGRKTDSFGAESIITDQLVLENMVGSLFAFRAPTQLIQVIIDFGAGERSRTPDRLITNQLLYQLSYASVIWLIRRVF